MTRLAANRDTHLDAQEIAAEALRQFDEGEDAPSMRTLARALRVAPSAIYHHFRSRDEIVQAAVEMVWDEAAADLARRLPDPFTADPVEVLVTAGVATRRAFSDHHRLAPHLAEAPLPTERQAGAMTIVAAAFDRMGLGPAEAAVAFHTYSSFALGAALLAAGRRLAAERCGLPEVYVSLDVPAAEPHAPAATRAALDAMMSISAVDPARDEELFELGLRRVVESLRPAAR